MNRSETIANLAAALAKAQAEFPAIPRTKVVKVTGQRGSYEFRYAPFEDILRATKEARSKNGLAFVQSATNDGMETVVLHSSGEWLASTVPMQIQQAGMQGMGSALTYASRYGFCKAFGIQADDDDDGNAADGNHVEPVKKASNITPKSGVFESLPLDLQNELLDLAHRVNKIAVSDPAGALAEIHAAIPESGETRHEMYTEMRVGLDSLLDSKTRSALTKYRNSLKEAA